ncbi:hypothetical protein [Aurantiacibacter marinus]|uniref:Uracil-DNA glycosylase-like domain-containing protein n=1 Tax=Aurantiacibacter marinus TaxID=874156 RepID=A0A0H0XNV6_9SPHN|nr:hypothetical protein [Aurantiacibacter marinus]KLI64019.1 hypothetical protein AAV99_10065 [Aurantiacibacter marinus]
METRPQLTLAEQYSATLDWWRDAGVDCLFEDDVQNLLANEHESANKNAAAQAPESDVKVAPEPVIPEIDLPKDMPAFRGWWMDPETPLPSGHSPRIAPRGEIGAQLMLLVPMPEVDDRERLLAGPQGKMLDNIAIALGIDVGRAYFASAIPGNMTLPDWGGLLSEGAGAALQRHIELAKPQRVILFGSKLPAMLGHDPAAPPESFTEIANIPALTTFAPDRLLDHPRQRARLWHRLLQWTA